MRTRLALRAAGFALAALVLSSAPLRPEAGARAADPDFVVISSSVPALSKGATVGANQRLTVPAGTRVVLMDGAGKVVTLRGPYEGPPAADAASGGLLGRLSEALRETTAGGQHMGVARGTGSEGLGLGLVINDPWIVDLSVPGTWCAPEGGGVRLIRGLAGRQVNRLSIDDGKGGRAALTWPSNQTFLDWPGAAPLRDGANYELRGEPGPVLTKIALRTVNAAGAEPTQLVLRMAGQGCRRQAAMLLERMERGQPGGRLFDLVLHDEGGTGGAYKVGDELRFVARTTRAAHLYCFFADSTGSVTKIYPSQFETSARVAADSATPIPAPTWSERLQLTAPAGAARVICVALDRDATASLPPEIVKPGFQTVPPAIARDLIGSFRHAGGASVAVATLTIAVR